MTPYYADDWLTLYGGDCLDVLREMPADSVDCVVTSPPYWGLRDYGSEGQLGLERTPEEYVANMVNVFREVRRVLKPSGTCWLNLGDSYATGGGAVGRAPGGGDQGERFIRAGMIGTQPNRMKLEGLKPKDLVGIPWRVAFALQADGWYLRSDIIWSKPNPMPESVTDRPTKSHEYLFLLTKSPRYFFDADAVREKSSWVAEDGTPLDSWGRPIQAKTQGNGETSQLTGEQGVPRSMGANVTDGRRNIRSVWTIATRPYPGAHFAVFPPELPERCIKAGSSEKGVCPECGAPWERTTEKRVVKVSASPRYTGNGDRNDSESGRTERESITTGWKPTCKHPTDPYTRGFSNPPMPAVVLDPFGGSGTVGMVANRLSRRAILIDLNPELPGAAEAQRPDAARTNRRPRMTRIGWLLPPPLPHGWVRFEATERSEEEYTAGVEVASQSHTLESRSAGSGELPLIGPASARPTGGRP